MKWLWGILLLSVIVAAILVITPLVTKQAITSKIDTFNLEYSSSSNNNQTSDTLKIKDATHESLPNISLLGTIITKNSKIALISINSSPEKYYSLFDELAPELKLIEINKHFISVLHYSKKFTIYPSVLTDDVSTIKHSNKSLPTKSLKFNDKLEAYINNRIIASVPFPIGVTSSGVRMLGDNYYQINRELVEDQIRYKQAHKHIKFEFEDDKALLTEVVPGSVFDMGGLLPGDEIVSIAQQPIHSFSDLLSAYSNLDNTNHLTINVVRDDKKFEIRYEYD